jgi:hypothetical protein
MRTPPTRPRRSRVTFGLVGRTKFTASVRGSPLTAVDRSRHPVTGWPILLRVLSPCGRCRRRLNPGLVLDQLVPAGSKHRCDSRTDQRRLDIEGRPLRGRPPTLVAAERGRPSWRSSVGNAVRHAVKASPPGGLAAGLDRLRLGLLSGSRSEAPRRAAAVRFRPDASEHPACR